MRTQISPRKVLFLVTLSQIGGAQKYVADLAKAFSKEMKVVVAAGGEKDGWLFKEISTFRHFDISTYHLPHLARSTGFLREFLTLFDIIKIIRKEEPDLLHLNSTKIGGIGGLAGFLARIPSVYTVHGLVLNDPWPWYLKIFYWIAEKIAFFLNDRILCVSRFDEQSVLKYHLASKGKIRTIHNALPLESIRFLPREEARGRIFNYIHSNFEFRISNFGVPLIGSIAGHFPTLDIPAFIKASAIVSRKVPEALFFVIGSGPETQRLEQEIRNQQMQPSFFLLGAIPNASKLLLGFDLFVLSAVKVGFPYALLEVQASGVPVVSTNVGGVPEIAHGLEWTLLPPKQPNLLARAILQKMSTPQQNPPPTALAEIEKKFSSFLEETKEVYRSLSTAH